MNGASGVFRTALILPVLLALAPTASAQITTFNTGDTIFAAAMNNNFLAKQNAPVRTVVVSPVPGDEVASGTALLAAMANITTASATNPGLVLVEPGVYDLGSTTDGLTLKSYVDLRGSGEGVTTIKGSGSQVLSCSDCINVEVSRLTVDATAVANYGIYQAATTVAGTFTLSQLTVVGGNGNSDMGIFLNGAGGDDKITIRDVTVSMTAGSTNTYGIYLINGDFSIVRTRVTVAMGASTSTGGGIRVQGSASVTAVGDIRDSVISVSGASAVGIQALFAFITNITVVNSASGADSSTGIFANSSAAVFVHGSRITATGGATANRAVDENQADADVRVADSMLEGDTAAFNTPICVNVYNAAFAVLSGCGP